MKYLVCLDDPMPTDGTCVQQAWVDQPQLLPLLSVADANAIAVKFLWALASIMAAKIAFRKPQ